MASGSFSGGYFRNRGGGSRVGRNGAGRYKNSTAAMNRRLNNSFYAMDRSSRVRGQRNATARASDYMPF